MSKPRPRSNSVSAGGRSSRFAMVARLALAAGAVLALALPSRAEEAGAKVWARGGCAACHGNLAAGDGDPAYPPGPNLRRTRLERDLLIETISCGRPSTPMPTNLRGAYTQVSCYGLPVGEVPAEVNGKGSLTAEEVETLTDFLLKYVVGKTRITRENCAVFNDGNANAPECLQY